MSENESTTELVNFDAEIPSDSDIMAALGVSDTEEAPEAPEAIVEETSEEVVEEEPKEFKSMLEQAKEAMENEQSEETETEGTEEVAETEGSDEEEAQEEPAITETTEFEVKIDGEMEKVTLQDLKNDYSGRVAVAKRFTELDKEKKELYNERSLIEKHIAEFAEKAKSGDILTGIGYLAEIAGIPPYAFKEQVIAATRPEVERRYQLSDDQKQKELLAQELDYMKAQKESETKRQSQEQTVKELQTQVNSIRETHGITQEIWDEAYLALDKELPPEADLTIDQVRERSLSLKAVVTSSTLLSEFDEAPESAQDALTKIIIENPDFTQDDLRGIITSSIELGKEQAKEAKAKEVGSKLKGKVKGKKATPKSGTTTKEGAVFINGVEVTPLEDDEY